MIINVVARELNDIRQVIIMEQNSFIHENYFEDEELEVEDDLESESAGPDGKRRDKDPRRAIEILNEQRQLEKDLRELFW